MATISITTPSDGQTIDASDVATPLNTIVSEINGSLDSDNISSGGVVPNNLTSGTGTSWAWQSWTPTYTNLTEGNGTTVAKYIQIGKTVHFRIKFTMGSTSSMGSVPTVSLPVTISSEYSTGNDVFIHSATLLDSGTANFAGTIRIESTTTFGIRAVLASGTYAQTNTSSVTATVPFTWTTGDSFMVTGTYEAA